jgi:hypothetical protein
MAKQGIRLPPPVIAEIRRLATEGMCAADIVRQLDVSQPTVKNYASNLKKGKRKYFKQSEYFSTLTPGVDLITPGGYVYREWFRGMNPIDGRVGDEPTEEAKGYGSIKVQELRGVDRMAADPEGQDDAGGCVDGGGQVCDHVELVARQPLDDLP